MTSVNIRLRTGSAMIIAACMLVALAVGVAFASTSYADTAGRGENEEQKFDFLSGMPGSGELRVLMKLGISLERASQALELQRRVASTDLVGRIDAALGGAFAGVWFEPAAAKFHVGVTSPASAGAAADVAAQAGLASSVVLTRVRSTWAALIAAQNHWNAVLEMPLARGQAMTGIDARHNAVAITVSSSVPAHLLAALKHEAATLGVNVIITTVRSSVLPAEPAATCRFLESRRAWCERTIVSGVRIEARLGCSAGPMLMQGNETYMLTAGHCFGEGSPAGGTAVNERVTSEYPSGVGGLMEIGSEGRWYENRERDMAEVKIAAGSSFRQALPTPVPALLAEWGVKTEEAQAVIGEAASVEGQSNCRVGATSGEKCGMVKRLDVSAAGTDHLVEDSACAERGDSGGPSFFSEGRANNVTMQGVVVASKQLRRCSEGEEGSWYEPLKDTAGLVGFSILSTFAGQALLTTANETRRIHPSFLTQSGNTLLFTGLGADPIIRGVEVGLPVSILCEKLLLHGFVLNLSTLLHFLGLIFEGKCVQKVNGGAAEACTEPITTKPVLAELGLLSSTNKKVLLSLEPDDGTTNFVSPVCGGRETKVSGQVVGEIPENNKKGEKQLNVSRASTEVVFATKSKNNEQLYTEIFLLQVQVKKSLTAEGFLGGPAALESTVELKSDGTIEIVTNKTIQ